MTFDARSKERLEALGRTLPKKLPPPTVSKPLTGGIFPSGPTTDRTGEAPRHQVEREEDPASLFRALMQASPDGHVPPHLLDRLRDLEAVRGQVPGRQPPPSTPAKGNKAPASKGRIQPSRRANNKTLDDADLYTAFTQLLLEDDDLE